MRALRWILLMVFIIAVVMLQTFVVASLAAALSAKIDALASQVNGLDDEARIAALEENARLTSGIVCLCPPVEPIPHPQLVGETPGFEEDAK